MPKGLKIIGYILFGLISFAVCLYLTFPFEVMKDRMLANVEKGLRGRYAVSVGSVSPRLIAGVMLKAVKFNKIDEGSPIVVWEADKVKIKASLISLLFRRPKLRFDVRIGGGRISGRVDLEKTKSKIGAKFTDLNLASFVYLASKYGLNLKSKIDGKLDLDLDQNQLIRSSGVIDIQPESIKIGSSKIKTGALGEIDIPEISVGAGKSSIAAEVTRGAIKINSFRLEGGDVNIDLAGSIYLSSDISNFRLNLKGTFDFSEKVGQALPFLFIIEKQKGADGKFPLTISGRIAKPQIKIGDFNVPL